MGLLRRTFILAFCLLLSSGLNAQDRIRNLNVTERIDDIYVFGFDLTESRSAKGGIWNTRTGKPETPLNYSKIKKDTTASQPVIMLYRQVALGNHPLNGWEIWVRKDGKWVNTPASLRY